MVGILKKRFKEISDRKIHRVKARWFDPLNKQELEKLNISYGGKSQYDKGVNL